MDQLRNEISLLEREENNLQEQLSRELDDINVQALSNQINIVRNRLSEKRYELQQLEVKEQQRAEAIEEKVHADGIEFAIDGVDFTDLDTDTLKLINIIVRADRRKIYNEHAIELEQIESEKDETTKELEKAKTEVYEKSMELLSKESYIEDLEYENAEMKFSIKDLDSKREASELNQKEVREELIKANAEIQRLNGVIAEYEQANEYRQRQDSPVTGLQVSEAEEIKATIAAINKKKYTRTENWGSVEKVFKPDGSFEVVPRSELSEWEPTDVIPPSIEVPAIPQFQDDTVQEHTMDREVDEEATGHNSGTVTREEFEALKYRVECLELDKLRVA